MNSEVKTDPDQFKFFHEMLTANRPDYQPFYHELKRGSKDPITPPGYSWKRNGLLTFEQAYDKMKEGSNIAIAARYNDPLVIVDIDNMDAVGEFKPTLTGISSKRYGRHAFYFTEDEPLRKVKNHNGQEVDDIFHNTAKRNIATDGAGEIRSKWEYVVCAGSYVYPVPEKLKNVPEDEIENAGKYTVMDGRSPVNITYIELPKIYRENHEADKTAARISEKQRKLREKEKAERANNPDTNTSAMWELDLFDVTGLRNEPRRIPSIFHDSTTGKNIAVKDNLLHCFRCLTTHNGLTALAVIAGVATCRDGYKHGTNGLCNIDFTDGKTVYKIWSYAKEHGIIPQEDSIPRSALVYYAVSNGYCKQEEVIDGWQIPQDAYNKVIEESPINFGKQKLDANSLPNTKTKDSQPKQSEIEEISTEALNALVEKEQTLALRLSLPDDHFISKYTRWASSITDAFYEYQVCGALWLLSACVEGNFCLKLKQNTVYPNLWINCLGKSTTSRKTTAVNKAKEIYELIADVTLYNDDYSLEGYLESLAQNPIQHFVRDEAAGLLAKMHKQYNEGIFEAECAIYDGQSYKKTLSAGKSKKPRAFEVQKPYVTHLYATTPDNYAMIMTLMDFLCGYGLRFLFCCPNYKREKMDLQLEEEEDIEGWAEVLITLKNLRNTVQGQKISTFTATPDSMKLYNQMLRGLEDMCESQDNELLNAAIGRNQIHILKIAMLLEIGKKEPSFCITVDSIKTAFDMIVSFFLPSLFDVINRLQMDIKSNQVERVIASLRNLGGKAKRSKLLQNTNLKKRDFDECIETLIESEVIKVVREEGQKAVTYLLMDNNDVRIILERVSSLSSFSCISSLVESTENLTKLTKMESDDDYSSRARDEIQVLQTKGLNKLNRLNGLKEQSVKKELLPDLIQFCCDWERIMKRSISRANVIPIAMEYCQKRKYHDVEGVAASIYRYAGILIEKESSANI